MLRKLIIIACLVSGTHAIGQQAYLGPAPKNTQKPVDTKIDYKQMGAPMPSFVLIPYHDTSTKNTVPATGGSATAKEETRAERKARKKEKKNQVANLIAVRPFITDKDLDNGANMFIMMFNPTCSHCTDETQMLEKNIGLFKKSKLVLMANPNMKPYMANFVKTYHTDDYPGTVYPGIDSNGFINNVFLYQALPQINIYSGDRKLLKTYTGEVAIDSLMRYIQ